MTRSSFRLPMLGLAAALALAAVPGSPGMQKAEAAFLPLGLETPTLAGPAGDAMPAAPASYSNRRSDDAAASSKNARKSHSDRQDKALWTLLATAAFVGGIALLDAWLRRRTTGGC